MLGCAVLAATLAACTSVGGGVNRIQIIDVGDIRTPRDLQLGQTSSQAGIDSFTHPDGIWAVAMDLNYSTGLVTVVARSDGSASIYAGKNGAEIRSAGSPAVRYAVKQAVALADLKRHTLRNTEDKNPPPVGSTRFFVLSTRGLLSTQPIQTESLTKADQPYFQLFSSMHDVIMLLRAEPEI